VRPAPFTLARPGTVPEALALLADGGRPLAGGQSLVPQLTRRELAVERLVDLGGITELRRLDVTDAEIRIGAMVTLATLEDDPRIAARWPLLAEAVRHVGHRPIRVRSTVGGTLAFGDPPAEVPLALAVLGARTETAGPLITAVTAPAQPTRGWGFHETARRLNDRAPAVAAALLLDPDTVRLGTATAATTPQVVELTLADAAAHPDPIARRAVQQAIERAGADA